MQSFYNFLILGSKAALVASANKLAANTKVNMKAKAAKSETHPKPRAENTAF